MRPRYFLILLLPLLLVAVVGCSSGKSVRPDTPENLASLAAYAISIENFEQWRSYFTEPKQGELTKKYFDQMKPENDTGATEIRTYSFLKRGDRILLLEIVNDPETQSYKIQNVIEVPKEQRDLFDGSLTER
ncbi:hypothetical protein [Cohnella thailandensis]|uniref:DUF3887 domain-containing protein n=1 Tax=Cohnella thailandensis TaxID=557557 RepID=A0A841SY00_9BACL|nr:hypothetical protein [Cohnella thailandensis]MBB6633621.1 hypothetical protein [Cohnella thailandensis]MBP1976406.1 hypothetical protein [Cohnella thailandensis]